MMVVGGVVGGVESRGENMRMAEGWLGVAVRDAWEKSVQGAVVTKVLRGGPADSAGIVEGDIILFFNTNRVRNAQMLVDAVTATRPGEKVTLSYLRDGKEQKVTLTVDAKPKIRETVQKKIIVGRDDEWGYVCGMQLRTLTEQLAGFFGVPEKEGVLVEEVEEKSPAAKAGIQAGDVIIRIGKKRTDEVRDVWKELRKKRNDEEVEIEIVRNKSVKKLYFSVEDCGSMRLGAMPFLPPSPQFYFDYENFFDKLEKKIKKIPSWREEEDEL